MAIVSAETIDFDAGIKHHYGFDTETHDPLLTDMGASWVFGQGKIIVAGLYDAEKAEKKAFDGNGGAKLRAILSSASSSLVGASLGYDLGWECYELGMQAKQIKCQLIDVSIAESLIDEYQPYSLDALALKYLRERKGHEKLEVIAASHGLKGDFRKHLLLLWEGDSAKGIPQYRQEIRDYVISDADQPWRIWLKQKAILEAEGLMPAFVMNMKMVRITLGMKQRGVPIDKDKWNENAAICQRVYKELDDAFVAKYGKVNFRSGKQMAELFDSHGVPYKYKLTFKGWTPDGRKFAKTDWFSGDDIWAQRKFLKQHFPSVRVIKGKLVVMVPKQYAERTAEQAASLGYTVTCNPSINKFTFAATKNSHQIVADIMEVKQVGNIVDKFLGPNFERFLVLDKDGVWRIHGDFNPVGARQTGRLSASHPNLQNIPSKTVVFKGTERELNLAKMCREVFTGEPGELYVKLDFSGQENVLQAHFAVGPEGRMIRAMYTENPRLDEHQFVANASGLQEEHGKEIGRKYAKNVRFGLSYGMQVTTMCEQFGWDHDFAEELIEKVKGAAPWVPITMDTIQDMLLAKGDYSQGGRDDKGRYFPPGKKAAFAKRYIITIMGRRIHLRQGRDRDAYKFYNYLIQGSASDMMKMALIAIDESESVETLLLTVHDEGGFSVPPTPEGVARTLELQKCMQNAVKLSIKINCDPEVGKNWASTIAQETGEDGEPNQPLQEVFDMVLQKLPMSSKMPLGSEDDDIDFVDEDDDENDDELDW